MKRTIALAATSMVGSEEFVVEVKQEEVSKWALEFALLLGELVKQTELRLDGGWSVVVSIRADDAPNRTVMTELGERKLSCELSRPEAEYLHATFLRAYRDEMA